MNPDPFLVLMLIPLWLLLFIRLTNCFVHKVCDTVGSILI